MIRWLSAEDAPESFPPVDQALADPSGLLAVGGDLSPARLLAAYARGIFPWYSPGQPVLWWSPDPREVIPVGALHISRSLARTLRRGRFTTSMDTDFAAVIDGCAAPRACGHGTWITPAMRAAYIRLHELGHARSFEIRLGDELVGGTYGVAVGRVFCAESMFSRVPDASKAALVALAEWCRARGIELIDCQLPSPHLRSLGSRALPRAEFLAYLG
jgi:leucyl/phenylalanyl-tRNA--protein transferase